LDGLDAEETLGVEGPEVELPPLGFAATLSLKDRVFVRSLEEAVHTWLSDLAD
jgi:hypothetical protein